MAFSSLKTISSSFKEQLQSDKTALCTLTILWKHLTVACSRSSASLSQLAFILTSVCFQEEDLNCVRERWSEALIKRREYLDEQIKKIINKPGEL